MTPSSGRPTIKYTFVDIAVGFKCAFALYKRQDSFSEIVGISLLKAVQLYIVRFLCNDISK